MLNIDILKCIFTHVNTAAVRLLLNGQTADEVYVSEISKIDFLRF